MTVQTVLLLPKSLKFLPLSFLLFCSGASAICVQSNIPLESYREFAASPQFAAVGMLRNTGRTCTATLVDPYTILTARHCIEQKDPLAVLFGEDLTISFELGTEVRKLEGIRYSKLKPSWSGDISYSKAVSIANDLVIAYLDEPIEEIVSPKISPKGPKQFLNSEIEFAGFGSTVLAKDGYEMPDSNKMKLAGKNKILEAGNVLLEGVFNYNYESRLSLNACPSSGTSGTSLLAKVGYQNHEIVGVATRGTPCEYGADWEAVSVFPHLSFIHNAMAFKEIETRGGNEGGDWQDDALWQTVAEKAPFLEQVGDRNEQKHDDKPESPIIHALSFGRFEPEVSYRRRFAVNILQSVYLRNIVEVSHLAIRTAGSLALSQNASLKVRSGSIDGSELTFVIGDRGHAKLHASKELRLKKATLNIDFQVAKRPFADREVTLKRPNFEQDCLRCRSFPFLLGPAKVLATPALFMWSLLPYMSPPKEVREWKIITSDFPIQGKAFINIMNAPLNYEVSVRQEPKAVIVKAAIR